MDEPPNLMGTAEITNIPLVTAWAAFVATCGGLACGLAIDRFGEFGSVSLWPLGALSGYVGRKIMAAPSRSVGWGLVVANLSALVVAEVCWIHWNLVQGTESWWAAVGLLPTFVREYELAALIAGVFCIFGAWSAYQQTAMRYRLVAVD